MTYDPIIHYHSFWVRKFVLTTVTSSFVTEAHFHQAASIIKTAVQIKVKYLEGCQ